LRVSPVGAWRAGGLGMDGKASGWVSLVEGLGKRAYLSIASSWRRRMSGSSWNLAAVLQV
jgi:hypothetical protein